MLQNEKQQHNIDINKGSSVTMQKMHTHTHTRTRMKESHSKVKCIALFYTTISFNDQYK